MKIDLKDDMHRDSPFFWFLVETLTAHCEKEGVELSEVVTLPVPEGGYDFEFRVNGHEIDIRLFVERCFEKLDHIAAQKAKAMLEEKLTEKVQERLNAIHDSLRDVDREIRKSFGLDERDE